MTGTPRGLGLVLGLVIGVSAAAGEVVLTAGDEWKAVDLSDLVVRPGSALDFSGLVPRSPADRRIVANARGGFSRADAPDDEVRFLSFNILPMQSMTETVLPANEDIERYAETIMRHGYTMVRLHFLDEFLMGTRLIPRKKTPVFFGDPATIPFHPDRVERLFFFVAKLKERGIHLLLDLGTSATGYTDAYPWDNDFRYREYPLRLLFDPVVRANWRAGVIKLLATPNPHTGLTLAADPVVACVVLYNEQSVNLRPSHLSNDSSDPVETFLGAEWRRRLRERHQTMDKLRERWSDAELPPGAAFDTLPPLNRVTYTTGVMGRDLARFFVDLQVETTEYMNRVVAETGYPGLVTHWDWINDQSLIPVRAQMPVVSNHAYWGHPNQWVRPGSIMDQTSAIERQAYYLRALSLSRMVDRPYIVSECGYAFWHRYRHEQGLLAGAYASLQGWGGISQAHQAVIFGVRPMVSFNNGGHDPITRASEAVIALAYLRGDVSGARRSIELSVSDADIFDTGRAYGDNYDPVLGKLYAVSRLGLRYTGSYPQPAERAAVAADVVVTGASMTAVRDGKAEPRDREHPDRQLVALMRDAELLPAENLTDAGKGVFQSDTGEILMDMPNRGLTVATPRLAGTLAREAFPAKAGGLTVERSSVPASVAVASLDAGKPLERAERILVVYATDALNSNMRFDDPGRTVIRDVGELPVLMQTGKVELTIANQALTRPVAYVLGFNGARRERLPVERDAQGGRVRLSFDTAKFIDGPSPFIEIVEEG